MDTTVQCQLGGSPAAVDARTANIGLGISLAQAYKEEVSFVNARAFSSRLTICYVAFSGWHVARHRDHYHLRCSVKRTP